MSAALLSSQSLLVLPNLAESELDFPLVGYPDAYSFESGDSLLSDGISVVGLPAMEYLKLQHFVAGQQTCPQSAEGHESQPVIV